MSHCFPDISAERERDRAAGTREGGGAGRPDNSRLPSETVFSPLLGISRCGAKPGRFEAKTLSGDPHGFFFANLVPAGLWPPPP